MKEITQEEAQAMKESLKAAWQIINVLTLSAMDDGEPYPKALFWLKDHETLGYPQPKPKNWEPLK